MNNWIEEEAERYQREKEEQIQKEELINSSNHWIILRQQIERDVNEINNHAIWKEILGGIPLVVQNLNEGFQIQKTTHPAVIVSARFKDRQLEMKTEIKAAESNGNLNEEILQVDAKDGKIVLRKNQEFYVVPIEASRYILSPIINALKNSL
jgi:hypothetical protein